MVDNTFATPILCRPFEFGADIVTHSTTKYMDGHACVVGGVVVDSGKFDWAASGKYPELTTPDESYHGVVYTQSFGPAAYIAKARVQLMRDLGSTMQPMAAFLLNLGLETLALRIRRHSDNALQAALFLEKHPQVAWVNYPGLESSPQRELAKKYLPLGCSGVVSFGVKGGRDAAMKFHGQPEACGHRGARGRRPHQCAASRQHHSPAAYRQPAGGLRREARNGAHVHRH